jgi:hypothetical protein
MAKLTVFFKDRIIHSDQFENGIVRIGRDETNDIIIDSLAVAPVHAVVVIRDDSYIVKQMNYDFPLMLNGVKIKEAPIKDNDTISLGKHDIHFNTEETVNASPQFNELSRLALNPLNPSLDETSLPSANLQILNGENIGKIITIRKKILQIGRSGSGIIVITKRKDGYFVSILENIGTITLNDSPINDSSLKLNNNDILVINNRTLQFFLN